MDGIISYTEDIRKFISGKKYAGKNIQTSDGKAVYITQTGIAKPYNSINSLSNLNGCTTAIERIDSAWGDMGVPVGSLMADGQSCGNETKYVQSLPPQSTFDWKYYIKMNPSLNLTNEQQALSHWQSVGIFQGMMPNDTILNSMTNIGKIGYVDVNTNIHTVPQKAYSYKGIYKMFDSPNVTGTTMEDCSRKIPSVKYGDQIYITYNGKFGSINNQSILTFGNNQTTLFLRPPVGNDALTGTAIKYGDPVSIAVSSSNVNTSDCGWYGCKVANINYNTGLLTFGQGGKTGGNTFTITAPTGTTYQTGMELKYLDPFSIMSYINYNNTLQQNDILTFSNEGFRQSLNGKYVLVCILDLLMLYDVTTPKLIWKSDNTPPKQIPNLTSKTVLRQDGNLILYNNKGLPVWSSFSMNKGQSPYSLKVENNGNVVIYDANSIQVWATNTTQPNSDMNNVKQSIYGYAVKDSILFNSNKQPSSTTTNIFSFQSIQTSKYDTNCDTNFLQNECNIDTECTGFLHSETENTWQKIIFNSTKDMFKITDKIPKLYVKDATVNMKDKSCLAGKPNYVDATVYDNYPKGDKFIMNGDQCSTIDGSKIQKKKKEYDDDNVNYVKSSGELFNTYPDLPLYTNNNNKLNNKITEKTQEYKSIMKQIKEKKSNHSVTLEQQEDDLTVMERANKSSALLWGISAIVIISMIVLLKHRS